MTEHPEWFRRRPDGTIQYAENPPKKYQDIYPFDFESERLARPVGCAGGRLPLLDRPGRDDLPRRQPAHQGVRVLGVGDRRHQARPPARCSSWPRRSPGRRSCTGWPSSASRSRYTYFTWRNDGGRDARVPPGADRAAGQASSSDRTSGRTRPTSCTPTCRRAAGAAFEARFVLAATLSAELRHLRPGLRARASTRRASPGTRGVPRLGEVPAADVGPGARRDSLRDLIARVNRARREHPALQSNERLWFHPIDNRHLLAYTKNSEDRRDVILTVVNFDSDRAQSGVLVELAGLARGLRASTASDRPSTEVRSTCSTSARYVWQRTRRNSDASSNPQRSMPASRVRGRQWRRDVGTPSGRLRRGA